MDKSREEKSFTKPWLNTITPPLLYYYIFFSFHSLLLSQLHPNPILFLFPQIVTHFSLSLLYSARFANSQIETRPRANWRREGQKIWSFNRGVSGVSENEAQRWNLKWRRRGETNGNDDVFVAESGRWLRFNVQEEKELSAAKFHWPRTVTTICLSPSSACIFTRVFFFHVFFLGFRLVFLFWSIFLLVSR